ncbi:MAG: DUF364 domain-containing protein [Xanthobacteraceae bacterium]
MDAELLDTRQASSFRQPCQALQPNAFALEAAERWALEKAAGVSAARFRLASFWFIDFGIQHVPGERKTFYTMRLAQSENYGLACNLTSAMTDADETRLRRESDTALVGEDTRDILKDRRFRDNLDRAALVDLVMGHIPRPINEPMVLDQTVRDKHAIKSRVFADEAEAVLQRKGVKATNSGKPHVLVIGAMVSTLTELVARGFQVTATDMSPDIIGRSLGGLTVRDGKENESFIETADLLIVTGMTLVNGTLPSLVQAAKNNNTSTMIWAVTGKNFGPYYTEHGIDCVISDPSPFFYLPGPSSIEVWRRDS